MTDSTPEKILAALTPEIVTNFKRAIELGKWPDGRRLTDEQRVTCLQAVILWEGKHLPEEQRTGYINKEKEDGEVCDDHEHPAEQEAPVKFLH
jgi:uncharacterized protein YeaC (DUF1315 family)